MKSGFGEEMFLSSIVTKWILLQQTHGNFYVIIARSIQDKTRQGVLL
jgi:hypothetical protein